MSDTTTISFPSASKKSKLSACPTTKIPQAADWIYQDFFHAMMDSKQEHHLSPSIQISELFPQEKHFISSNHTFSDEWSVECPELDNSKSDDEEEEVDRGVTSDFSTWTNVAPVLIESTISTRTNESTEETISFREIDYYYTTEATLKKRKSTSSFSSFKSFMSVFNTNKKSKLYHPSMVTSMENQTMARTPPKKLSMTASISKKLLKYFKRRL